MKKDNKGQPSGTNKNEGLGLRPDMPSEKGEPDEQITDKYTTGADEFSDNVRERHLNRNTDKDDRSGPPYS